MSAKLPFAGLSQTDTGSVQAYATGISNRERVARWESSFMACGNYQTAVASPSFPPVETSADEPGGDGHPRVALRDRRAHWPRQYDQRAANGEYRVDHAVLEPVIEQRPHDE